MGPHRRARRLVETAGHEPVTLAVEEHDLHGVGAVWLAAMLDFESYLDKNGRHGCRQAVR